MPGPISIRPAALADALRLAELSATLGYPVPTPVLAQTLERLLARADNAVLVATATGDVIGWIHGADHELLETGRQCEILGLVVDAGHRRQGVGRLLIAAVEDWAAARGIPQVAVRSNVVRIESHPFYEGLGYTRVKTQHSYRKALRASGKLRG